MAKAQVACSNMRPTFGADGRPARERELTAGDLVTRVDLPLSGVARLKGLSPHGAIVETYQDGRWTESRTLAPPAAYRPATSAEIVAARHGGRLPPARGLYPIDDDALKEALQRPGLTEREVDAIMLDPAADRDLKLLLIAYVTALGYPTVEP